MPDWLIARRIMRYGVVGQCSYIGADKSLARHTSRCILFDGENILFDGENISFDASLVIRVYTIVLIFLQL